MTHSGILDRTVVKTVDNNKYDVDVDVKLWHSFISFDGQLTVIATA